MRITTWLPAVLLATATLAADAQEIYLIPFSHLDLFWAGTREECLARGNTIVDKAVGLAKRYPDYRFMLESEVFVANYVESHRGTAELADFTRLVKEGRIEISPMWAGIYQNLVPAEAHVRNFLAGKNYARSVFGVDPLAAELGDLPGYTPQFPQILVKSGTPYTVMTRMGPPDHSLFRWKAPDGTTALTWHAIKGHHWGITAGLHRDLDEKRMAALEEDLREVEATTKGPVAMHWGVDLWTPSEKVIDNLPALNQRFAPAHFHFSTLTDFFRAADKVSGVDELAGDIPGAWSNTASALNEIWPTEPANALVTAEKFAALDHALGLADYPQDRFDFLWKKLLESMDHNHGGQGGSIGIGRKQEYGQMVQLHSEQITRDMLRNIAEHVRIPMPSHPVVVFNPLGWKRDDLVRAHVTLYGDVAPQDIGAYRRGLGLVDEQGNPIPFAVEQTTENMSRALDLTFVARGVPALGYKTYYLLPADHTDTFPHAAEAQLDSDNDRKTAQRPLGSDALDGEFYRLIVDKATGRITVFDKELNKTVADGVEIVGIEERGGNSIGVEPLTGRTFPRSIASVALEKNNNVRAVMRIEGDVAGIPITQRVSLYRGLKRIDIENTVNWPGSKFIRLDQVIPHGIANANVWYGIPFGANPFAGLMPGTGPHFQDEMKRDSWLQTRQVQEWVDASGPDSGLSVGTDHQLVMVDPAAFRGVMIRGTRFSLERVVENGQLTSYAKPSPGTYVYRYSLVSHSGDWRQAHAWQVGAALNTALIPVSVTDELSAKSLPPTQALVALEADNLVVSALKKAEHDNSLVLRFFDTEGKAATTHVTLLGRQQEPQETNMLEQALPTAAKPVVHVGPYEIKTVKLWLTR
jgi:alpha-mannosidase